MLHRKTIIALTVVAAFMGHRTTPANAQCQVNELTGLFASDNAAGDRFGQSTAIYGNIAVVGATGDDDNGPESGSAYVFHYDGAQWVQVAKLLPSDGAAYSYFGVSVAIDGDTVVIGAHGDAGAAYIFEKPSGGWTDMTETAKLTASDAATNDNFGLSVTISGKIVVIGALYNDDNGDASGSAYVFEEPVGGWVNMTQTAKLLPSDGVAQAYFGTSVAIAGDSALVGAHGDDDNGYKSGSVYVFDEPPGGWADMTQTGKLVPADGGSDQSFGHSVAASGNVAVIGAPYDDDNGWRSGSAYIVRFDGVSWVWDAKLLASNGTAGDVLGEGVAISDNTVVVGAPRHQAGSPSPGSAYVFEKPTGGWVNMTEDVELIPSDSAVGDRFGGEKYGVAVSDGIAVVGAFSSDVNGEDAGAAYAFHGLSDCNGNGVLDTCDIDAGTSPDVNGNGIPDECDPGACCLGDLTCVTHLSEEDCESQGGTYDGGATTCECTSDAPVPAVSEWGMVAMTLLVLSAGTLVYMKRKPAAA